MKNDVLLIAHFCSEFDGKGNNRFNYIANRASFENVNIELITSDFSHSLKKKRSLPIDGYNYKITYIEEPPYNKNVSIKRFLSHYRMGLNLKKYLERRDVPNVIYCSVPSLSIAYVSAMYAKKNNIKFIIDVQDLWPQAFRMIFNIPILSNVIFFPFEIFSKKIYESADEIIAVSETYGKYAIKNNKKCKKYTPIYIGTELQSFDKFTKRCGRSKGIGEFWMVYVGTLGHSYDLYSAIDALKILKSKGINIKFIVMGDGPLKERFQNYALRKQISVEFTGILPYHEMVGVLKMCDVAINPITKGAAQSIINKHADYLAAGLPIINTQENEEFRNLLDEYEAGFNCKNSSPEDIAAKLELLYYDAKLIERMKCNSRYLAELKFDRFKTYEEIINLLKFI